MRRPILAVTSGEPAGIGPDICISLADIDLSADVVVLADRDLMRDRARSLGYGGPLPAVDHVPLRAPCIAGRLDPANGRYVLDILDRAVDGCLAGRYDAMVTAPVHKGVINDAGIPFTGHTEYLAARTGTERVVWPWSSEIRPPMTAVSPSRKRTMVDACFTSVTGAVCFPSGLVTMACRRVIAGRMSKVMTPSLSICGVTARIVPMVIVEMENVSCVWL